jgi:hypothetical protein
MAGEIELDTQADGFAREEPKGFIRRVEDFAIDNMRYLTIGASTSVVMMAAVLAMPEFRTMHPPPVDSTIGAHVTGSVSSRALVPQASEWQVVRKPIEVMALEAPQFEKLNSAYASRRNSRGDREDAIEWRSTVRGGAEARVALLRHGPDRSMAPSLFVDAARQQAERGVSVTRAGASGPMETKFGPVEVADMTFIDADGLAQACLVFRRAEAGEPTLSGWRCAAAGDAVERPEVACLVDRLTLLKSGDDQTLRRFFAEAEARRKPCPNARSTAGRKPTWLDHDGRPPAIRGVDGATGSIPRKNR